MFKLILNRMSSLTKAIKNRLRAMVRKKENMLKQRRDRSNKSMDNLITTQWVRVEQAERKETRHFCTMTGKEYLLKVLAMYHSLQSVTDQFILYICCMDNISCRLLSALQLQHAVFFPLADMEDPELLSVKGQRKINEYCWTLKAPLIRYVLDRYQVGEVIYCDGDLYFFSDPEKIYEEWGNDDVFLCPQRDLAWVENMYGKFQAGLAGFKNTDNSLACLQYWRTKCIEWCYSYVDTQTDRYGDQKYLDQMPFLFSGVKVTGNLGVDAAPWNCIYNNNYNIYEKDREICIEKDKLLVFHFATIAVYNESEFDLWSFNYIPMSKIIMNKVYLPYLSTIRECINMVRKINGEIIYSLFNPGPPSDAKTYYRYQPLKFMLETEDDTKFFCTLISGEYLIKGLAFYHSLAKHVEKFRLWICCVDETSYFILNNLNLTNVILIALSEIEDDSLKSVKPGRQLHEFCWTLKAPLVQYVLSNYDVDHIIYCDADLFIFSDLNPVYESWKGHSVFLCRQRDSYEFEKTHGSYQAGFIGFRNDRESHKILAWWREKCVNWCFDILQPEFERWGDQKYLDSIPMQFSGIKLDDHKGINAAPWNVVFNNDYRVSAVNDKVYIDEELLIMFHFGSMLFYNENEFDLWKLRPLTFDANVIVNIYLPYLKAVKESIQKAMPYSNSMKEKLFINKALKPPVNFLYFADIINS